MKVGFKSAIFWCWIWASIHSNHFYNLKSYSAPTCIWITLSNLGWFFQKISITYDLGQNCWDKTWPDSMLILGGEGGEFGICKIEWFLEFTGFSTFLSKSFVHGCSFYSRIMLYIFYCNWSIAILCYDAKGIKQNVNH